MQNRASWIARTLLAAACLLAVRNAWAQTQPATLPAPTVDATVTEWVVFVADPYASEVNGKDLAADTLPPFVDELRAANTDPAKAAEPMPVGVIRITGGAGDKETSVDVALNYKEGRTLATWPAATVRPSGIVWRDLALSTGAGSPLPLPAQSWIAPLRNGTSLIKAGTVTEPFLLYDVTLQYPVLLKVSAAGDGAYRVVQPMDAQMHDLTFYQQDAGGQWMTATIATLAKTEGASMPKPVEKSVVPAVRRRVVGTMPAASEPAASAPSTQPQGTRVTLAPAAGTGEAVLASWGKVLGDAGVTPGDRGVALHILSRYALDPKRLTAVYRMDPAELEKLLPLEVLPQPRKVSRVALVVVTGIDPRIETEMDGWIAKLGSPSWKEREAAMEALRKAGPMARGRLEKATKDKDMEIVYRAEQLLEGPGQ